MSISPCPQTASFAPNHVAAARGAVHAFRRHVEARIDEPTIIAAGTAIGLAGASAIVLKALAHAF